MDDSAIIQLFWDRDGEAVAAAQEKYGRYLFGLARRLLGSEPDAEECVSDAMMRLWETIPPSRPQSLRAYAAKILRNLTVDRWRRSRAGGAELTSLSRELEDCLPPSPSAEDAAEQSLITDCLERWLDTLTAEDRTLFLRRYWYGDTVKELAKRRGIPANRLAQRLYRLRAGLRGALEKEGISI